MTRAKEFESRFIENPSSSRVTYPPVAHILAITFTSLKMVSFCLRPLTTHSQFVSVLMRHDIDNAMVLRAMADNQYLPDFPRLSPTSSMDAIHHGIDLLFEDPGILSLYEEREQ